jgi:predicted amidohydrolase
LLYKVGVVQFRPLFLNVQENLKKLENLLSSVQADLLVLPELATSGYLFKNKQELEAVAESAVDGVTVRFFKKLAKEMNTSYVVGFAEKEGKQYYNSSLLANPDGQVFIYRKTHLFFEEKQWFQPGNLGFNVFAAKNGVKVGLMICFDWIFPESSRTLTLRGAQIIAHSANLVLPWCQQAMITRSLENQVFSITANRIGTEVNGESELTFTGMSQILSTKGEILHRCTEQEETVQIVEICPEKADDKQITKYNHLFSDRRPELYER